MNELRSSPYSFIPILLLINCVLIFAFSINNNQPIEAPQIVGFITSVIIFSYGVVNFLNYGSNAYNVFILFYFGFFSSSLFMISYHQHYLEWRSLHYIFTGPIIVLIFLYLSENLSIKKIRYSFVRFNPNHLALSLLAVLIAFKGFIFIIKGVRLIAFLNGDFPSGDEYTIPLITGLSNVTFWLVIFMIPYVKTYKDPANLEPARGTVVLFVKKIDVQ